MNKNGIDPVRVRKLVRELRVDLTNEEKVMLSEELSDNIIKKRKMEEDLKVYSSDKKSSIARLDALVSDDSHTISAGYRMRDVECIETTNFILGIRIVVRKDTMEEVYREALQPHEMQTNLFDGMEEPKDDLVDEHREIVERETNQAERTVL